jgi:hypothetical protein
MQGGEHIKDPDQLLAKWTRWLPLFIRKRCAWYEETTTPPFFTSFWKAPCDKTLKKIRDTGSKARKIDHLAEALGAEIIPPEKAPLTVEEQKRIKYILDNEKPTLTCSSAYAHHPKTRLGYRIDSSELTPVQLKECKDLKEIVREYLDLHLMDGLCSPWRDCGCRKDELFPCDEPSPDCQPGYAVPCSCDGECGWHIIAPKDREHLNEILLDRPMACEHFLINNNDSYTCINHDLPCPSRNAGVCG